MSPISHHDPEKPAIICFRKRRFDHLWMDGAILDNTYMRSLIIDGLSPADAAAALRDLKAEKQERMLRRG